MATNKAALRQAAESPDLTGVLDLDAKGRTKLGADREPLFKLGGVLYTIPTRVSAGVSLEYMRLSGMAGERTAIIWAMQTLIDQNGYAALVKNDTFTAEELSGITAVLMAKVIDGFKVPKA